MKTEITEKGQAIAAKEYEVDSMQEASKESSVDLELLADVDWHPIQAPSNKYAHLSSLKLNQGGLKLSKDSMETFNLTNEDLKVFQKSQYPSDLNFCAVNIFNVLENPPSSQMSSGKTAKRVQAFCDNIHKKEL